MLDKIVSTVRAPGLKIGYRLAMLALVILVLLKTAAEIWSIYEIAVPRYGSATALWVKCVVLCARRCLTAQRASSVLGTRRH